jgi:hypothetical protein
VIDYTLASEGIPRNFTDFKIDVEVSAIANSIT